MLKKWVVLGIVLLLFSFVISCSGESVPTQQLELLKKVTHGSVMTITKKLG